MSTSKVSKQIQELEEKLRRTSKALYELETLNKLSQAISCTLELDKIIEIILSESTKQVHAAHSSIMLMKEHTQDAFTTLLREKENREISSLDQSCRIITGWVLKNNEPLLDNNILAQPEFSSLKIINDKLQSVLAVPMKTKGEMVGVMVFQNLQGENIFNDQNLRIISIIASQSAQILENARLYNLLKEHSQTLEQKVKERTQEIADKNVQLESTLKELRETQDQLIMQEKMASIGNLAAGVAHEVNNPIGAVNSAADVVNRGIGKITELFEANKNLIEVKQNQKFQQIFTLISQNSNIITEATNRVSKIVQSLKDFARLDEAEFQKANIHEGIKNTLMLLQHELRSKVKIIKEFGEIPEINCYPNKLNQVIMNMLLNAAQAITDNGIIRIETFSENSKIYIKISDSGIGIPPENIDNIFDPGFTTKGVGVGTGLGLSTCYNIIQKHHGEIKVESKVGKGTVFTIIIPENLN